MTDREKIIQALAPLRASDTAVQEVWNMAQKEQKTQRHPARTGLLIAAAVVVLSVAALAAVSHGGFFNAAFGTGVKGQEAVDVPLYAADGSVAKTEHYPTIERVEVDEQKAEELVGDYVNSIGKSVTVGDWTFTVMDCTLDENSIGALTVKTENPKGIHELKNAWEQHIEAPIGSGTVDSESGLMMDAWDYVVEDSWTDTSVEQVFYFTPFAPLGADEGIVWRQTVFGEEIFNEKGESLGFNWEEGSISIPASEKIPAKSGACEGLSLSVSPVGLALDFDLDPFDPGPPEDGFGGELLTESIVLRYADGSEYVVMGDDLYNCSVSSTDSASCFWYAFNRLADADSITEIEVSGCWIDAHNHVSEYDYIVVM